MEIEKEVILLNCKYEQNNANGIRLANVKNNDKIILGEIPILLSAPHAVRQMRNGIEKVADGNTGGITEYLCKSSKCFGIIRNYNFGDDPNYDNTGVGLAYKQKIVSIIKENNIKLVIDIHGCKDSYNFDFSIGTNNGRNLNGKEELLDYIKEKLEKIGRVAIDECFKASLEGNISRYVAENTDIPCIQLEIANKFRIEEVYLEKLILSLQTIITDYEIQIFENK